MGKVDSNVNLQSGYFENLEQIDIVRVTNASFNKTVSNILTVN